MYATDAVYLRANGTSSGADEIVSYLKGLKASFPDHDAHITTVLVADNAAIVEWTETGSHSIPYDTGSFGVIAPTGETFSARIVDVFRFESGLIVSQHEYFDRIALLTDLGWIETTYRT
jgi:ketosteroid isomerase-like protein